MGSTEQPLIDPARAPSLLGDPIRQVRETAHCDQGNRKKMGGNRRVRGRLLARRRLQRPGGIAIAGEGGKKKRGTGRGKESMQHRLETTL